MTGRKKGAGKTMKAKLNRSKGKSVIENSLIEHNWSHLIDTGSTLLNLIISGGRVREGGIPGGAMVEAFGPSGQGKTALACEIGASVIRAGGKVKYIDPEGRLDHQYAKVYGLPLSEDEKNYVRPDTISEMFDEHIMKWDDWADEDTFSAIIVDGCSALTTDQELSDSGDPYGGRRAKEFSEGCRKSGRIISNKNRLLVFTSQVREKMGGGIGDKETTSNGRAIEFYASLRIRIGKPAQGNKIMKKIKHHNKEISKAIGICAEASIRKSSVDDPFRKCLIYLMFGYGLDDIRSNLVYNKAMFNEKSYVTGERSKAVSLEEAVRKVEEAENEEWLRNRTIDLWHEIENKLTVKRKKKVYR